MLAAVAGLTFFLNSCVAGSADSGFFGKTDPPERDVFRYVSGSEPESIDPQIPTGQPEARILMSIFEGLTEYDPKTMQPIPAIAERWDVNQDSSEFTFYLRTNARWSNGDPITAHDFVYTFQRGLNPALAARNAYLRGASRRLYPHGAFERIK
jgi:ABC-type oligopeptide transport system substrate-binding subunit